MSVHLHAERRIDRPPAEVAAFIFDAENNPRWQKGMRSCRWETPPPTEVGSTYMQEATFMGRPVTSRFRVTALDPGHSLTIETTSGTFPITVTRTVESDGTNACRVVADIVGTPGGLMGLLAPLTRALAQRSVDADYDRLVTLLSAHSDR
ncbi:MAG: SRPBCC family protein [Acidimicrobiia bacterium]